MGLSKYVRPKIVNTRMLLRIMGWLLIIEGVFMFIPGVVSFCYSESDWWAFAAPAAGTAISGLFLSRRSKPKSMHMGKRDGYLLTASVWIVLSLFGLLPFMLCSRPIGISDAFFEAVSGFTTTGASILPSVDGMGHGIHLWRALMQWIGGMGIILFTLAVVPLLNHSGGI